MGKIFSLHCLFILLLVATVKFSMHNIHTYILIYSLKSISPSDEEFSNASNSCPSSE